MTFRMTRRLSLAALPLLAAPAGAQPRQEAAPSPPRRGPRVETPAEVITDPRIERFDLSGSDAERATWRIQVARPATPPPPGGYPVIYLLDGNAAFPMAWKAAPQALPEPAVIVGIGHPTGTRFDVARRWYELTSPVPAEAAPGRTPRRTGGRAHFLSFIDTDLRPEIERRLPIDRSRQTLFGHSLGGLFVLYTLFTRPEMFSTYVAADPSIWWGDREILNEQAAFLAGIRAAGGRLARPIRLLIDSSGRRRPPAPAGAAPVRGFGGRGAAGPGPAETARALAEIEGFTVFRRVQEGESHGSMLPFSVAAALGFAFGRPPAGAVPG